LVLAVSGLGCYSRAWRTVRERQAECPQGAVRPCVLRVPREFVFRFVSIRRVRGFYFEEVGQTIRMGWPDSPRGSDRSWCSPGPSVIQGALLEVWFPVSDRPPGHRGLSAWCLAELLSLLLLVFRFRFGIV
jgi:hypothetical protein